MEFFIQGLLFFLLAVVVTFFLSPNATPMIAAIMSLVFLTYGIYDHYRMFRSEYRLSTWQQTFKVYAPYIMIFAIIIYAIVGMISMFTGGSVPVPVLPSIDVPAMPTLAAATNQLTNSLNTAVNSISDSASDLITNSVNTGNSLLTSLNNSLNSSMGLNNSAKRNGNMSRSALETL